MSCGQIDGRPAVRLLPCIQGDSISWGQDSKHLMVKTTAYLAAPPSDSPFWSQWRTAVEEDQLANKAREAAQAWAGATDLDLYLEMFAAYANDTTPSRWTNFPAVRTFFDTWRAANA
jgi:hypothetical protein